VSSIEAKSGASRQAAHGRSPEAAFDLWLDRCLRQMCESVAAEPLPEALLRLVNEDRGTTTDAAGKPAQPAPDADKGGG